MHKPSVESETDIDAYCGKVQGEGFEGCTAGAGQIIISTSHSVSALPYSFQPMT